MHVCARVGVRACTCVYLDHVPVPAAIRAEPFESARPLVVEVHLIRIVAVGILLEAALGVGLR